MPAKLIDIAIRLDHFDTVPLTEISRIASDVRKNLFTKTVLRDLVANHMYLFHVDYRLRQELGALLDIMATETRYLENPDKKEDVMGFSVHACRGSRPSARTTGTLVRLCVPTPLAINRLRSSGTDGHLPHQTPW